jgi:TP901 family phage tail tape measure protein
MATVGGVDIQIRGDNVHFLRELRESERQAGRTGQTMAREFRTADAAATRLGGSIKGAATSMLALTAALGAGAGLASGIRTLADFGQAMSTLQAVTGATTAEIALLEAEAKRLGGSTRFSASQAAEGMIFLARAGFTAAEALQAVEGTLTLAQAGGLDLGRAADIASNVLGGFNIGVDQTARVVDVLAKAANSANVTVESLGEALKFAAPTSAALGLSLEETVAVLGKLGDSGLSGGIAGSNFNSFATSFVSRKDEITAIIGEFDLASEGLNNVIRRLVAAGITTEQVVSIFRAENLKGFTILANASQDAAKGTEVLTNRLNDAGGTAARVAATMDDNLNGAILGALSAFEALILAMGEAGANSALISTFKGLGDLLRFAARNADVLGVAIVALAARAIIPMAISAVPAAITALRGLGTALLTTQGLAARTAVAMSFLGGPLTLAIAGAAAAYIAYSRSVVTADEAQAGFNATADKLKKVRDDTRTATDELKDANDRLTAAIEAQSDAAEATARTEINAINARLIKNRELEASYRAQLALELNRARTGAQGSENRLGERLGLRATFDFTSNRNVDDGQLDAKIGEFMRRADAIQKAGGVLSKYDAQTLEWIIQYREYQETLRGLEGAFNDLTNRGPAFGTDLREFNGGRPQGAATPTTAAAEAEVTLNREGLAIREQIVAIDLARAQGNEALARHLEEELDLLQAQLEYQELGLDAVAAMDAAITEIVTKRQAATLLAQQQAEADEASARALQQYEEFDLRRKENKRVAEEAAAAEEAVRQSISDGIARGLEEGIRTGNWGEAFRNILARATSDALSEAINDLATELVSLLKGVFSGIDFGSIGSSVFGGARAGGGSVRAGMRYMVGEQGPEMFVPSVPGAIVPKFEGPASMAGSPGFGVGAISISAPFIVQGSITEEVLPRVQAMMAAQARELPRVIDARVTDSLKRGRY